MIEFDTDALARMESEHALANSQTSANLEALTMEVNLLTAQIAQNAVLIGRKLNEMKQLLPHGEFMPYIEEHCGFKQRMANQFMRIAAEYTVETLPAGLGVSKVYELLALPAGEREEFVATHDAESMTVRQLREEIRRTKQALDTSEAKRQDLQKQLDDEVDFSDRVEMELKAAKDAAEAEAEKLRQDSQATPPGTFYVPVEVVKEVPPADYEEFRRENEVLKERLSRYERSKVDMNSYVDSLMGRMDDAESFVIDILSDVRGIIANNRPLATVDNDCFQWLNHMVATVEGYVNDIRTSVTAFAASGGGFGAK